MNGSRDGHPSFLELDRLALDVDVPESVRVHVEGCAECAAYVSQLQQPLPVPGWVKFTA